MVDECAFETRAWGCADIKNLLLYRLVRTGVCGRLGFIESVSRHSDAAEPIPSDKRVSTVSIEGLLSLDVNGESLLDVVFYRRLIRFGFSFLKQKPLTSKGS